MTHIPNNLVFWSAEYMVKRHRELRHTQARTQMPTYLGHRVHYFLSNLVRQQFKLLQILNFQLNKMLLIKYMAV